MKMLIYNKFNLLLLYFSIDMGIVIDNVASFLN